MGTRAITAVVSMGAGMTTTGAGTAIANIADYKTYQASGVTTNGAGAATIAIEGSNDGFSWNNIGTLTLVLATTLAAGTGDSFTSTDRYRNVRYNVTAISGTGASVSTFFAY